jgi:hypothetical protein
MADAQNEFSAEDYYPRLESKRDMRVCLRFFLRFEI